MKVDVRVRSLDLGLPAHATDGYGSAIVGVPTRRLFLMTYVELPAAYRLLRFDLDAGEPQALPSVGGELHGSAFDARSGRLHALLTYGLFELSFEPFAIGRKVRNGVPKFAHTVTLVGGDALAVRAAGLRSCARVTLRNYSVNGRYRIPGIDAAFMVDGTPMVFAFGHGLESKLGADGLVGGRPLATTRLLSPVVTDDAVFGIAARRAAPAPGRLDPARPAGAVVRLDKPSRSVVARRSLAGVRRLLGVDAAGRLVAVTGHELVLLDAESLEVVARRAPGHGIARCALAGQATVVAAAARRECRQLSVLEWDEDLDRRAPETTPIRPARVPAKTVVGGRSLETNQQYRGVRLEIEPPYKRRALPRFVVGGQDFRRCDFYSCTINCLFGGQRAHYLVRDVKLERCRLSGCSAANVAFEECLLDRPTVSGGLTLTGCVFKHVIIRGNPGFLCIYDYYKSDISDDDRRLRREETEAYYRDVDWALDIREAETEAVRIRNVPLELVRRDARRTLLVWTKDVDHPVWRSPPLAHGLWRDDVVRAAADGQQAVLLSKLRSPKYEAEYAAAERSLREAGLVDDLTGAG